VTSTRRREEAAPGTVRVRLVGEAFDAGFVARILRDHPEVEFAGRPAHYSGGRTYITLRVVRGGAGTRTDEEASAMTREARPPAGRDYTHPDVFTAGVAEGWAEAETDPARIDWPERQARAAIPFEVTGGRPVNPCERTGIARGRNEMGFWGEQKMADALVTVNLLGTRYLLMVERGDGYGWAVPGGHVEPGETGLQAAVRELAEETGLDARGWPFTVFREMPPRYVPDPRSSDEAWAVTVPVHVDLGDRDAAPAVNGGDDARRAEWIPARNYTVLTAALDMLHGRVFAAHVAMLGDFLGGSEDSSEGKGR